MGRAKPGGQDGQTKLVDSGEAPPNLGRGFGPKGNDGTHGQTASSLRGIDLSVRENCFEGGNAALVFEGRNGLGGEKAVLEWQVEELDVECVEL